MTSPANPALTEVLKAIDGLADVAKDFVIVNVAEFTGASAPAPPAKRGRQAATRKTNEEAKEEVELTLEAVREAFLPLVDKFGNAGVKEILGQFNASKMSKLEPGQFADVIEAVTTKLAVSTEPAPEPAEDAVTIEQVRAAIEGIKDQFGNKGVKEFLANFKVSKISDIDAADYADVLVGVKDFIEDDPTA